MKKKEIDFKVSVEYSDKKINKTTLSKLMYDILSDKNIDIKGREENKDGKEEVRCITSCQWNYTRFQITR